MGMRALSSIFRMSFAPCGGHYGSKDPNNRVLGAQILYCSWYLGPKTLLFGSLDP